MPFFPYYYLMNEGAIIEEWGGGSEKNTRVLDRAIARVSPPQQQVMPTKAKRPSCRAQPASVGAQIIYPRGCGNPVNSGRASR